MLVGVHGPEPPARIGSFSLLEPCQPRLARRLDVIDIVLEEPLASSQHIVPVHQW